ncbi:MAG: WYL domain-containing protein [Bacillota bacterium]|nr:WYL domain-containing protein [Bacillota bacterium]
MTNENNTIGNKDVVKRRIFVLLRLLYEQTDEEHQMTSDELVEYLKEKKVPANKKTLKSDIDLMTEAGLDIVTVSSKPNRYFWGSRHFEVPELKLLIDAVSSSRFITQKKSEQLVKKLTELASVNQKSELKRHLYATNRVKTSNESIFYTVDTINQAITQKRKITFKYTEYDGEKNIVFRNGGEVYELSPYALFWNEDYYYVVGYSEKHENVSVFRVDRLYKPEITKKDAAEKPDDFNLDDYSRQIFEMYDGEMVKVQIKCKNELMKYVIDRFGEGVKTRVLSDNEFTAEMEVALSPNFYAWVFRFGGAIKILAPEKAVDEITEMAKAMIE